MINDINIPTIKQIEEHMLEMGYGWAQAYWELLGCPEGDEWKSTLPPLVPKEHSK